MNRLGTVALIVVALLALAGIYAPFLASSKPLFVSYDGHWYFPLFRYLFFPGYFTKGIDRFFNLLMFVLPAGLLIGAIFRKWSAAIISSILLQLIGSLWLLFMPMRDPAVAQGPSSESWQEELTRLNAYGKLNLVVHHTLGEAEVQRLGKQYGMSDPPTAFALEQKTLAERRERLSRLAEHDSAAAKQLQLLDAKQEWLNSQHVDWMVMPLFSSYHWEENAGGERQFNKQVHWYDLRRVNGKHLLASLLFGMRISLSVGVAAVALSLVIGIPLGALAGYRGGRIDLILSRFTEIWESMPTFFMLLMIVAIMQQKSVFLVVIVMGLFGWTLFCRYARAEVLKQRSLAYVESCRCQGFTNFRILFRHILPNAIPPILTLLPFAIMGAITREAGLSFLGLGEEGSASWGVLMDEGRTVFPAESYLLWPPAILLTILLVLIAIVGDAMRDALDPKMR